MSHFEGNHKEIRPFNFEIGPKCKGKKKTFNGTEGIEEYERLLINLADKYAIGCLKKCDHPFTLESCKHCDRIYRNCRLCHINTVRVDTALLISNVNFRYFSCLLKFNSLENFSLVQR